MKAEWNNHLVAESSETVVVEGNHYFPEASLDKACLVPSDHTSYCPWKGTAHYYSIRVGDQLNENAAWFYPEPKKRAKNILGHVAFWHGVKVS